ncbi:MAG: hypothetical protein Q4D29_00755 [Lachnospiraceae bacterium]|nr:hypothetical protein [Lachnospiraceae bacterium]
MKKKIVLLLTTVALTVLSVMPVFASETAISAEKALIANHVGGVNSAISTLVTFDNNCGEAAKTSMHAMLNGFNGDIKWSVGQEEDNYIKYLQACVGNALETERIKKQNVGAMADVVKVNPTFQPQLDAAVVDYNKAVADRLAAEAAVIDAKAQFAALNASFIDNIKGISASDADAR